MQKRCRLKPRSEPTHEKLHLLPRPPRPLWAVLWLCRRPASLPLHTLLHSLHCTATCRRSLSRREQPRIQVNSQPEQIPWLFLIYPSRFPPLWRGFAARRAPVWVRGARVNELGTVACWSLRGSEPWFTTPRRHIQINSSPASHAVRRKKKYIWRLGGFLQFKKIAPCKFKKRTETQACLFFFF